MLVDQDHLAVRRRNGLGIGLRVSDLITRIGGQIIQAGFILVGAGGFFQAAACEIFKAGIHQLLADLVVIVAAGLMGIEGSGGGMVEVHRTDDAYLPALLAMKLFRNGFIRRGAGEVHIDHAGIGFVAGGNGGGSGSRVRRKAAGIIGHGRARHIKVHKIQALGAVQLALALFIVDAGQCFHIIGIVQCAEIVGGCLKLRIAHAITDEQKYILGRFGRLLGLGGIL